MDSSKNGREFQRTFQGPRDPAMGLPDVTGPKNPRTAWPEEEPDEA